MGSWYRVTCPSCGARPGTKCRTLTTNKITDLHAARHQAVRTLNRKALTMSHVLAPAKPKAFDPDRPGSEGTVWRYEDFDRKPLTYLFCGKHFNDSVTGKKLDEPVFLFWVWQGEATVFRLRATKTDLERSTATNRLIECRRGLSSRQMMSLAHQSFRDSEELEYRKMGLITS